MKVNKYSFTVIVLLILAGFGCATNKSLQLANRPELVVYEYCKEDAYGARLSTDTIKFAEKYYVRESPPELGWTYIYLISDYKIQQITESGDTATVNVIYNYLATLDLVKKDVYVEDFPFLVEFNLNKEDGIWKIASFKTLPCVYKETALNYLKQQFKSTATQEDEDRLLSLMEKVKALKEQ